jgi:hypothetical protein
VSSVLLPAARKSSQNIAFRGFTGKILSRKDLRAAEEGWESPGKTRFGNSRVVTVTYQTLLKTQKGRSAGRGGSCPTSRVWVGSATWSSYESSKWRSHFSPPPEMGMVAVGRNPSASGARDDSPPFQRSVEEEKEIGSPGDDTGFCLGVCPALAKRRLEWGSPGIGKCQRGGARH